MNADFRLVTPFTEVVSRDFALVDTTLVNPNASNPLIQGEFLELNTTFQALRGTNTNPNGTPSYALFAERGQYDVQGLQKVPLLYMRDYEAETKVFMGIPGLDDLLVVSTLTGTYANKRGLRSRVATPADVATAFIAGVVVRPPANNNNWCRFRRTYCWAPVANW